MPLLVSGLGVLVSIGFMIVAAIMNWHYGLGLERSDSDKYLFAAIAGGIDTMKVLLTFFMRWAYEYRRWTALTMSALLTATLMSHSVTGIAGFIELNQAGATGALLSKKGTSEDLHRVLKRKQSQIDAIGTYEPAIVTDEMLQARRHDRRWQSSQQCNDATAGDSRAFCAAYRSLEAEKAKAVEAEKLEREIVALRHAINALAATSNIDRGDPRAGFLSRIMGWELLKVQTALSLLLVVIIEGVATFGIYVSMNHGKFGTGPNPATDTAEPSPAVLVHQQATSTSIAPIAVFGDIAQFAVECLQPEEGGRAEIDQLYPLYQEWCTGEGTRACPRSEFSSRFAAMCERVGLLTVSEHGQTYCINIVPKTNCS
jgi:hypothetical protein